MEPETILRNWQIIAVFQSVRYSKRKSGEEFSLVCLRGAIAPGMRSQHGGGNAIVS